MKLAQRTWFVGLSALVLAAVSELAMTTNAVGSNNEGTIEAAATDTEQPSKRSDTDKAKCCAGKNKASGCQIGDEAKCSSDKGESTCGKAGDQTKCCADKKKSTCGKAGDKNKCCADKDKSTCKSGDKPKCGSGKSKCCADRKVDSAKEPDGVKDTDKKTPLPALTDGEQKILQYLKQDWKKRYRTTNIEQAMTALGMLFDDQQRRNIGEFLKQNQSQIGKLHWGWITFTLTNNEKHLGRYIAFKEAKHEPITSIDEIGQKLKVSNDEITQGLRMLRDIGFLSKDVSSPIGYRLSPNASQLAEPTEATFGADRNLGFADHGSLGFTTHTVRVNDGPEFNVACFADYIILAEGRKGAYGNEVVSLRDTCLHCVEPITITYEKGRMVKLEPRTAIHVATRGCGGSNVFSSIEHYREWKKQHPKSGGQRVNELKNILLSSASLENKKKAGCCADKDKSACCKAGDKAKCCADGEKAACQAGDKAECGEGKRCADRKKADVAEVSGASEKSASTTKLHDLNDIQQFRKAFNAANGRPRLILLLSPT